MKRIGLIVNPIAGLGGRVGLKGSDGLIIQRRAMELGAIPKAMERAAQALQAILSLGTEFDLMTYPSVMGENAARKAGVTAKVLGSIQPNQTTSEDTVRAACQMKEHGAELLLFAGGDGTACDICNVIGVRLPALGIPAGVKIHSAVYATHPRHAGELVAAFLRGETELRSAEVLDLDENVFRSGLVSPRLYGYLQVPYLQRFMQGGKVPTLLSESTVLEAIAEDLAERMKPGWLYIFGPGSTTHAVTAHLGMDKTLLGVDAIMGGEIIAKDASEADLLRLLSRIHSAGIVVTPIGGQGCIFGRGNQPISPDVIRRVRRENIHVISTPEKVLALNGQPLWVDTGDPVVDELLSGYFAVITGYKQSMMYKVTA